jgi:hypothetical protein
MGTLEEMFAIGTSDEKTHSVIDPWLSASKTIASSIAPREFIKQDPEPKNNIRFKSQTIGGEITCENLLFCLGISAEACRGLRHIR